MNQATIPLTDEIRQLIADGAIFYCSHSGGKDSQAMFIKLRELVPAAQLVLVHADLGRIEWRGVQAHIKNTIGNFALNVVRGVWADGTTKNLLNMVERRYEKDPSRPCWPSSAMRFCTSDLKRDPIAKFIRRDLKARGKSVAVNCTGLRAEESSARAHRPTWSINKRQSNQSRTVYDWLPIHHFTTGQVFKTIADANEKPFWAYRKNRRLSCVFCIMGCGGDLAHGASQRPDLMREYQALEEKTGWTMFHRQSLADKIADAQTLALQPALF